MYMLPEILNISVPNSVIATAPSHYGGANKSICDSNEQLKKFRQQFYRNNNNKEDGGVGSIENDLAQNHCNKMDIININSHFNYEI
jgi:hypothetical protein